MNRRVAKLTFHTVYENNRVVTPIDQVYYVDIYSWPENKYKEKIKKRLQEELVGFIFDDDCIFELAEENDFKDKYIMNFLTLLKCLKEYTYCVGKNPYIDLTGKETPLNKYNYVKV